MAVDDASADMNADQAAYWNGRAGENWAVFQPRIDAVFRPITDALLRLAAPQPGEAVLDVGCGCGGTVLLLAERVGETGRVLGVDISEPMLEVARARAAASGHGGITLLQADAAQHRLPPRSFDLVFSRFGVMFFDDPVAAFKTMRAAMIEGGRLVFACWQGMGESSWFSVPFDAVASVAGPQQPGEPHAPGPFAFADRNRLGQILQHAGFSSVSIDSHRAVTPLSDFGAAVDFVSQIGPASRLLAELEPGLREAGRAAISAALRSHDSPRGVELDGAVWLVSAQA